MLRRIGLTLTGLLLAGAAGLSAQTLLSFSFNPVQPMAGQPVTITVRFTTPQTCYSREELPVILGNTIDLHTDYCLIGTPPPGSGEFTDSWEVRPLAAGTYTVRFLFAGEVRGQAQLRVIACPPGRLCLRGGRFEVSTRWTVGTSSAIATPLPITADTGAFWFFQPDNVETVVKVLDGCGINNHYWVFAAGLTNVATETTVTDTQTGAVKTYRNPAGTPFTPFQDTAAFACNGGGAS